MATKKGAAKRGAGKKRAVSGGKRKAAKKSSKRPTQNSPVLIKGGSLSIFHKDFPIDPTESDPSKKWSEVNDVGVGKGISHPKRNGRIHSVTVNVLDRAGTTIQTFIITGLERQKCEIEIEYK